jgi:hypothetical protein
MKDKREYFRFDHPKDIMIGKGRIVYEPSYETWILPGGIRTRDQVRAELMAKTINEITIRQEESKRKAVRK